MTDAKPATEKPPTQAEIEAKAKEEYDKREANSQIAQQQKNADKSKDKVMNNMVKNFAQMSYISAPGKELRLEYDKRECSDSEEEDDEEEDKDLTEEEKEQKKKEKAARRKKKGKKGKDKNQEGEKGEATDVQNLYSEDPNKIDLINNLNPTKLLQISELFEMMPGEEVDLDQFVKIMVEVLSDTCLSSREEFITELVDLFYRVNKENDDCIAFEDLTTYLIDHEIAFDAELGTNGGFNASNSIGLNMDYYESDIKDPTVHNNYIEKIHYFQQIDKVILYEQNMKQIRIYHGSTMKKDCDISCPGVILAIEYVSDKNAICVSLSDRTFQFFDAGREDYKKMRDFDLPSTQKCLCYVKRKKFLFSAGTDGAVYAWKIKEIFEIDIGDDSLEKRSKKDLEYKDFISEATPWFLGSIATCIMDLPNIEQIATGSYQKRIELWELRTDNISELPQLDFEDKTSAKQSMGKTNASVRSKAQSKKSNTHNSAKANGGKNKNTEKEETFDELAKEPTKKLEGHKKAIREIAYSHSYKVLVSVGFDFQVFVWNPYWEKEIIKLDGHESPLVGVNCPAGLECFITCDTKGMINVWNIKDYSQMQTFHVNNVNQVTSMRVVPKHRRLIIGSRVFKVFEYKKPFNSDTSDDNPILCALFSSIRFEFYIAGERSINVWNAKNGKPTRCFKNCFESDITCMALDKEHRKLIVGSHLGKIKVFDLLSGVCINTLESHSEENGEISFIGYGDEDLTIITTAWDRIIKVHKDDRNENQKPSENVLRAMRKCHKRDIISGDYAHNLGLIATGGKDNLVRIWDYERMKAENEIIAHKDEVTTVKFLKPFPLLMTADSKGVMYIWYINPQLSGGKKCVMKWINKFSMEIDIPISAVDFNYDEKTGKFLLLIGDEKGEVKIQDITAIITHYDLKPVDIVTGNQKRNPLRYIPISDYSLDTAVEDGDNQSEMESVRPDPIPELDEGKIIQINDWSAHDDVIKSIQYIASTDEPLVFTAGLDRMAYIWDLEKNPKRKFPNRGALLQGYMMKSDYRWDFPLSKYQSYTKIRLDVQKEKLQAVRVRRDDDKTYKKQRDNARNKIKSTQSNLAQTGVQFLGYSAEEVQEMGVTMSQFGEKSTLQKPSSYMMSKHQVAQSSASNAIYDDSSRGKQTQKVHYLLDQAKKVMARDQKNHQKQMLKTGGKNSTFQSAGMSQMNNQKFKGGNTTFQSKMNDTNMSGIGLIGEEEQARIDARRIGPFSFDIDDDIDTEVLNNEQVYDDLKELKDILDQEQDGVAQTVNIGKSKKR